MLFGFRLKKKYILLLTLILISCVKEQDVTDYPIEIKSFSFLSELNPSLTQDVNLTFNGVDTFSAEINELCDIKQLVASYNVVGGLVQVDSVEQTSGISNNDFNKPVTYNVANTTNY